MLRIFALTIMLSACASAPTNIRYYLLNTGAEAADAHSREKTIKVQLGEIILADYLQQPLLILQLQDNQIYYSPQDAWAENLQVAMSKSLLSDLNHGNASIQFMSLNDPHPGKASYQLLLAIDHFQATDQSLAIAQGHYWLVERNTEQALIQRFFTLQLDLEQDGYAHAVVKLRQLLTSLSQQINDELQTISLEP